MKDKTMIATSASNDEAGECVEDMVSIYEHGSRCIPDIRLMESRRLPLFASWASRTLGDLRRLQQRRPVRKAKALPGAGYPAGAPIGQPVIDALAGL